MAVQAPEHEAQLPADAAGLSEISPYDRMAPVIVIGGLLSSDIQRHIYRPLMAGQDSRLSLKDSFVSIPDGGLGDFDEMGKRIDDRLMEILEKLGERAVIVCQSLGGVFGMEAGLNHPDKIASVVSLAGVEAGIEGETPGAKVLKRLLGNPANAELLQADSALMMERKERIASEWSPDTSVHEIAATTDVLVPARQGLSLELPDGQKPEKRMVTPRGVPQFVMRRVFGMPPNAEPLKSITWADHVSIAWTPSVISYTRRVRRDVVAAPENTATHLLTTVAPELTLAAA